MANRSVDGELIAHLPTSAISLFAVFSRFECALKRSGYHHGNGEAHPNWDKFANTLGKAFFEEVKVTGRANLLIDKPPMKQIVNGDDLDWEVVGKATNVQELFGSIRRVRNNLFHGGKYRNGHVSDATRDEQLLRESLFVLELALEKAPDVRGYFDAYLG